MIPLHKVFMAPKEKLLPALEKTLYSGYISEGPVVKEFEIQFGKYIGNANIASCNSCTSAILLALMACGIKSGDEVITTPMSCVATNMPILMLDAKIVWADVDPLTGNIDPEDIKRKITNKTKAILYVHWGGNPAYIDEIMSIANQYNIKVIEDAAHALCSNYKGKNIGNHGHFVCFSLQAIKHLTSSDGGMIAINTDDPEKDLDFITKSRWFGLDRKFARSPTKWETDISQLGGKMHMNDVTATIGLTNLEYIDSIKNNNVRNVCTYDNYFAQPIKNNLFITNRKKCLHSKYNADWIYTLLVDPTIKTNFSEYMISKNIQCGIVHSRNDKYSLFKPYETHIPHLDLFEKMMINIPCGWWVSESESQYILDCIDNYEP